jgi:hypothetical protein
MCLWRESASIILNKFNGAQWCCFPEMTFLILFQLKARYAIVQHNVIKFVSVLHQVGGFFRVLKFPPLIKLATTI